MDGRGKKKKRKKRKKKRHELSPLYINMQRKENNRKMAYMYR